MILVYLGRWSYGRFQDDNNIFYKMENDLTIGTWQDDIWCPIIINLFCTSDAFHPPQSGKRTAPYSACILGVRLRYQHHGEHGFKVQLKDKRIQYQSVPWKGGFALWSFHFIFCYVLIKKYLDNPYTAEKILFCSFRWCTPFLLNLFLLRYFYSKNVSGEEVSFSLQSTALLKGTKDRPTPPSLRHSKRKNVRGFPKDRYLGGFHRKDEGTKPWVCQRSCQPALDKCEM